MFGEQGQRQAAFDFSNTTVQRQFEVVYPDYFDANWIPIGRDTKLEQVILDRISRMDVCKPAR